MKTNEVRYATTSNYARGWALMEEWRELRELLARVEERLEADPDNEELWCLERSIKEEMAAIRRDGA